MDPYTDAGHPGGLRRACFERPPSGRRQRGRGARDPQPHPPRARHDHRGLADPRRAPLRDRFTMTPRQDGADRTLPRTADFAIRRTLN